MPASPDPRSAFPPIGDYAFLSDCENTCLVAPSGAIEWFCAPKPHSPSLFGAVLDRSAGLFLLAPAERSVPAHRQYKPGTMVLTSTWQTRTGWLEVNDFLAIGPWNQAEERVALQTRTPGDFEARHVLVRTATCLHGKVDVALNCEPSFEYGAQDAVWTYDGATYDRVRTVNPSEPHLTLAGNMRFGIEGRSVRARRKLQQGETCFITLGWAGSPLPSSREDTLAYENETSDFWRSWLDAGSFPDHPWRELLQRSAITLKGLSYTPTGAILAAPTTSLPENIGGSRNWDYRYTWVRDAAFTLQALSALGFHTEAHDFLAFVGDVLEPQNQEAASPRAPRRPLEVLYPVDGSSAPEEQELDFLSGYEWSKPIRVGNAAHNQVQFDILGGVVDCIYEHTKTRDSLSERSWRIVVQAVEVAISSWREPDRGIWEVRSEPRHFTFSKVMCWVALDRGAKLSVLRGEAARAKEWRQVANDIHEDICKNAITPQGHFAQSYGAHQLDASLLLLGPLGFLPSGDPRLRETVLAIANDLSVGPFLYRYRSQTTDDGLSREDEGTFTVCSFWLVSALIGIGELTRAHAHCERLIGAASTLGLYGEELDPTTIRHLGNFPQALTHLALINALLSMIEAERAAAA
jgi:GH15 family glucan-1,4-alpha-glucosidase